jgi:hypothetical protein
MFAGHQITSDLCNAAGNACSWPEIAIRKAGGRMQSLQNRQNSPKIAKSRRWRDGGWRIGVEPNLDRRNIGTSRKLRHPASIIPWRCRHDKGKSRRWRDGGKTPHPAGSEGGAVRFHWARHTGSFHDRNRRLSRRPTIGHCAVPLDASGGSACPTAISAAIIRLTPPP